MTENEDIMTEQKFEKIMKIENYHISENMYLIPISILNNYLRLYY